MRVSIGRERKLSLHTLSECRLKQRVLVLSLAVSPYDMDPLSCHTHRHDPDNQDYGTDTQEEEDVGPQP